MQTTLPGDLLGRAGESLERDLNDWVTWMSSTPDPLMLSSWWALPQGWLLDFIKQYPLIPEGGCTVPTELNWQRWSFCLKHCVLWWQEEHWAWSQIIPTPTPAPSLTSYIASSPSSTTEPQISHLWNGNAWPSLVEWFLRLSPMRSDQIRLMSIGEWKWDLSTSLRCSRNAYWFQIHLLATMLFYKRV